MKRNFHSIDMQGVRACKNELRNYNYYVQRAIELGNAIEELYDRLGGVKGIDPSKEPTHSMPNKELEWKIRDEISRLEAKRKAVESKIREIGQLLTKMEEPTRTAITLVYIDGQTVTKVADMMYISPSGLAKRMNREIKKALD